MTVEQMMASMSSWEYARWIAFERSNGPIGGYQMQQEVLSGIHEQLQTLCYLFSQANFTDEGNRKGPIPPPSRFPRPYDVPDGQGAQEEPDLSEEWIPSSIAEDTCPPDCQCNGGTRKPVSHF
jgi:hypothetical protein